MPHIILFIYIAHTSFSIAGLTAMALLHSRLRTPVTAALLWIMACLCASVFMSLIQYYFVSLLAPLPGFLPLQYSLGLLIAALLYVGLLTLLLRLPGIPRLPSVLATLLVLGVQLGRVLMLVWAPQAIHELSRFPAIALISLYLLFIGLLFVRAARMEEQGLVALLLHRLGLLTIIFAPASTLFYFFSYRIPLLRQLSISLDFLYLSALSIITIGVFLRCITRPTTTPHAGDINPEAIAAYRITAREAEIAGLISQGLSNQQIADRLYVSLSTARTHIYNLFRKTGARNRIELLRIMAG